MLKLSAKFVAVGHFGEDLLAGTVKSLFVAIFSLLLAAPCLAMAGTSNTAANGAVFQYTLKAGDTISAVFDRYGLQDADLLQLLSARNTNTPLRELRAGQKVTLRVDGDGRLSKFQLSAIAERDVLTLWRTDNSFEVRHESPDDPPDESINVTPPRTRGYHNLVTVARGDSLYSIFKRLELQQSDLSRLMSAGEAGKKLRRLRPNQTMRFRMRPDGSLDELLFEVNRFDSIAFVRQGDVFEIEEVRREAEVTAATASGFVDDSLYSAATDAGIPESLTMALVNIFAWDVDFAMDIRAGDSFSMIYETHVLDGEVVRTGKILAAQFVNQGKTFQAVRYVNEHGDADYYTPEGKPLRRAFIRSPVPFARVSSKFNLRRRHPILHKIRAHKGVDYAAPTGTRVNATGDGHVISIGRKGGYGRTIVLQHGGKYTTLYAHLRRYARGLKVGSRVKQGQVIGYVGRSGLATGPHLHYEFRVNGKHRNPLTVPLPRVAPIARVHRSDFQAQTRPLLAKLAEIAPLVVADRN
ncbi:MAG: peptidoglycan DD-metalloendopeptidase family protein [Pseudomonadota bacterium]